MFVHVLFELQLFLVVSLFCWWCVKSSVWQEFEELQG